MTCEHLVCANCAHPVVEGRCATCRNARESLHFHSASPAIYAAAAAITLVLLFLVVALGIH